MDEIIVYFSRTGENYLGGSIKNLTVGNTELVAKTLEKLTGAASFKIEPIVTYSNDYNECIEEAKRDLGRNARPELVSWPERIEEYGTIYLGYPNYWGTMPMAVFTFLERYDFSGKTIKPFCTHEGSGLGRSESDIHQLCLNATVTQGLAILGSKAQDAKEALIKWI